VRVESANSSTGRSGDGETQANKARSARPDKGDIQGVQLDFGKDRTPACDIDRDPLCSGPGFTDHTIETVQRIGADSFTPDHGVMLTKNKPFDDEDDSCGYLCFSWMIDANPQDIRKADYYEPDGTPVMRSIGDDRQLNDGLFHAGTDSGSVGHIDVHGEQAAAGALPLHVPPEA
jgi:hypothetical protein